MMRACGGWINIGICAGLLCAGVAPSSTCHAQPAPLSLAQALAAARSNLDVSLASRAVAAALADIQAADHAPLPQLTAKLSQIDLENGIGPGNLVTAKRIDKSLGVDWTWERGNKRGLRTESARRSAVAAEADLAEVRTQQMLAAHAAFFDLMAAQERIGEVEAITRSALQLADTAARRFKAGDLAQQDAARAAIEGAPSSSRSRTCSMRWAAATAMPVAAMWRRGRSNMQSAASACCARPKISAALWSRRATARRC